MDLIKKLARIANTTNVLNGGVVMPESRIEKKKDHYLYLLHMPGVEMGQMNVEINGNQLLVSHKIELNGISTPHLIQNIQIPVDVDFKEIHADYAEDILSIYLPFNDLADGYRKSIDILNI